MSVYLKYLNLCLYVNLLKVIIHAELVTLRSTSTSAWQGIVSINFLSCCGISCSQIHFTSLALGQPITSLQGSNTHFISLINGFPFLFHLFLLLPALPSPAPPSLQPPSPPPPLPPPMRTAPSSVIEK